jgi:acetyltransferase-like isoleucine patch superfamily enzyme
MSESRVVRATHAHKLIESDPEFEIGLASHLRATHDASGLVELYDRFAAGSGMLDNLMRRVLWRALAGSFGHGVSIGPGVGFKHLETLAIGDGVSIGAHSYIQGRAGGRCIIGSRSWIGPQAYLDARDLTLGENVGWGPGAKVLGSQHLGQPLDAPIIATDLEIKPVHVEDNVDVGTGAILMPGVRIGRGAIVGAGAVVTHDVAAYSVVAGVPARFLKWRAGYAPPPS